MYIGEHIGSNTPVSTFQVIDDKLTFKKDNTYYYYSMSEKKFILNESKATDIEILTDNATNTISNLLYHLKFPYFYSDEYFIVYNSTGIYSFREREFLYHTRHTFTSSNLFSKGIKAYYNTTKIDYLLNYLYQHFFLDWVIPVEKDDIAKD